MQVRDLGLAGGDLGGEQVALALMRVAHLTQPATDVEEVAAQMVDDRPVDDLRVEHLRVTAPVCLLVMTADIISGASPVALANIRRGHREHPVPASRTHHELR
jgi:hypothetical protein